MCLIAYFLKTFYYFFRLVLNISLVGSWDCGFWIIWTQTPFSWLWLLQGGKGSSASSCFSSDTIWYLPISDTWLWWSPWVPVQAGPHPGPWRVLWIWQFPQAQILWGHFGSVFPTLEEAGFPVINPSRGLEPSPEITATDVGLALPAESGGGCLCGSCQTSMLEADFQAKSLTLKFYQNKIRSNWNYQVCPPDT